MKNPALVQIEELERLEREQRREYEEDEYDEEGRAGYSNEMHSRVGDRRTMRKKGGGRPKRGVNRLTREDIEEFKRNEKVTAFLDEHFSKFVILAALFCCIPVMFGCYDLIFDVEYIAPQKEACTRTYTLPPNSFCNEVDLVYTWVNGSDPKLHSDYIKYFNQRANNNLNNINNDINNDEEVDDDEGPLLREMPTLKYSIRAADTYAPWIRRIWIVTNGQVPSWLNVSNPRVRVVTHAEIFPNASDLPTFNSNAIESNLHRIPGLAECWFYQNDDFGFGRPVCLDDFLDVESGRQRLAFDTFYAPDYRAMARNTWHKSIGYSNALLNSHYYADTTFVHGHFYEGHNTRLFRTSVLREMAQRWAPQYANTSSHRFRDPCDIALPFLYNNVVLTEFGGIKDSRLFASFLYEKFTPSQKGVKQTVDRIRSEKPLSWCINDGAGRAAGDSKREGISKATKALEEALEEWLPVPSELELELGEPGGNVERRRVTIPMTESQEKDEKKRWNGGGGNDNGEEGSWRDVLKPLFVLFVCVWAVALVAYSRRVYKVCLVLFNNTSKNRMV